MAKRKSLKLGKRKSRATTSGKVYLNGNSYACLSGLYFTSLNNETAIEEWSKIPFLNYPTTKDGWDSDSFLESANPAVPAVKIVSP